MCVCRWTYKETHTVSPALSCLVSNALTRARTQACAGICMGTTAATKGKVTYDQHDNLQYCYRSSTGATPCTVTTTAGTQPTNLYACSLPFARHGHRATSFSLLGKWMMYTIFGGETTDLAPTDSEATSELTNSVHTLHFTAKTVTWIKLWTSCDDEVIGLEPVCPEPRRDMALSIMCVCACVRVCVYVCMCVCV